MTSEEKKIPFPRLGSRAPDFTSATDKKEDFNFYSHIKGKKNKNSVHVAYIII
jgi:hypothetical protein